MVDEAGFDVKIHAMEFASVAAGRRRAAISRRYLIGWSGRADPDGNLYSFLHTGAGAERPATTPTRTWTRCWTRRAAVTDVAGAHGALRQDRGRRTRKDLPIIYLYDAESTSSA